MILPKIERSVKSMQDAKLKDEVDWNNLFLSLAKLSFIFPFHRNRKIWLRQLEVVLDSITTKYSCHPLIRFNVGVWNVRKPSPNLSEAESNFLLALKYIEGFDQKKIVNFELGLSHVPAVDNFFIQHFDLSQIVLKNDVNSNVGGQNACPMFCVKSAIWAYLAYIEREKGNKDSYLEKLILADGLYPSYPIKRLIFEEKVRVILQTPKFFEKEVNDAAKIFLEAATLNPKILLYHPFILVFLFNLTDQKTRSDEMLELWADFNGIIELSEKNPNNLQLKLSGKLLSHENWTKLRSLSSSESAKSQLKKFIEARHGRGEEQYAEDNVYNSVKVCSRLLANIQLIPDNRSIDRLRLFLKLPRKQQIELILKVTKYLYNFEYRLLYQKMKAWQPSR